MKQQQDVQSLYGAAREKAQADEHKDILAEVHALGSYPRRVNQKYVAGASQERKDEHALAEELKKCLPKMPAECAASFEALKRRANENAANQDSAAEPSGCNRIADKRETLESASLRARSECEAAEPARKRRAGKSSRALSTKAAELETQRPAAALASKSSRALSTKDLLTA